MGIKLKLTFAGLTFLVFSIAQAEQRFTPPQIVHIENADFEATSSQNTWLTVEDGPATTYMKSVIIKYKFLHMHIKGLMLFAKLFPYRVMG